MDQLNEVLLGFLASALTLLLGLVFAYLSTYIKKASEALQAKSKLDIMDRTVERLEHLALQTVTAMEQESGNLIRTAVQDGKLTKAQGRAELSELASEAVIRIRSELGYNALGALEAQAVDVNYLVKDAIEAAVAKLKNQ